MLTKFINKKRLKNHKTKMNFTDLLNASKTKKNVQKRKNKKDKFVIVGEKR